MPAERHCRRTDFGRQASTGTSVFVLRLAVAGPKAVQMDTFRTTGGRDESTAHAAGLSGPRTQPLGNQRNSPLACRHEPALPPRSRARSRPPAVAMLGGVRSARAMARLRSACDRPQGPARSQTLRSRTPAPSWRRGVTPRPARETSGQRPWIPSQGPLGARQRHRSPGQGQGPAPQGQGYPRQGHLRRLRKPRNSAKSLGVASSAFWVDREAE